ncbi:hypothetical protein RRG08_052573 [Elysia crispata]|uniref:Uncharacterized protein n=1 Tax=Elysia crispata TaxID=231223 RepID=A0AAE1A2K8_9GAST|nr:hypothetical protein RRG08_052573 [Elysia crispata]
MKKVTEEWIEKHCREIEESLTRNDSRRAYQIMKSSPNGIKQDSVAPKTRWGIALQKRKQSLVDGWNIVPNSTIMRQGRPQRTCKPELNE